MLPMADNNLRPLHCPRCKGTDLVDYGDTYDCKACELEFEKQDLKLYDEEDILSVEEKLGIFRVSDKR